jgi:hypothetical protein
MKYYLFLFNYKVKVIGIINNTSNNLIAFGLDKQRGFSKDYLIKPGEEIQIQGAYLGIMGGGSCHISMDTDIVCVDDLDLDNESTNHYYVTDDIPLCLDYPEFGFTVRHESDAREKHTLDKYF